MKTTKLQPIFVAGLLLIQPAMQADPLVIEMSGEPQRQPNNSDVKPLSKKKDSVKRVDRPLEGVVTESNFDLGAAAKKNINSTSAGAVHAGAGFQAQPFGAAPSLHSNVPELQAGSDDAPSKPLTSDIEKFFEQARAPKVDTETEKEIPPQSDPSTSSVSSENQQKEVVQKAIIVRMTGFNEDAEITPKINFDAITMANRLLETKKRKCLILLERTGVKLATTGYGDMSVNGNLIDFRKLLKQFLSSGGEIVLNKKWCDEFSVQQKDVIEGVRILPPDQLAEIIVDSDKVIDYATPNYPFNLKFNFGQRNAPN